MLSIQKFGCILIAALMCSAVYAQNISVSGNITDATNGEPVPYASVHLEGALMGVMQMKCVALTSSVKEMVRMN